MITVDRLVKTYDGRRAVDDLSFTVRPGTVTGFLGPNGAGKSTTMRVILGLDRPTSGSATIGGHAYQDLRRPLHEVGALLDTASVHGGRTPYGHLLALARSHRIPARRVEQVLETVGLAPVARRRVKGFSLGMRQRLGMAVALLGDPGVLILDEPVNGLDPEGIQWLRTLLRAYAAEGRTLFVSSHLMSEMSLVADHLVIVGRGRLLSDAPVHEVVAQATDDRARPSVYVCTPDGERFGALLRERGTDFTETAPGEFTVRDATAPELGEITAAIGLPLHELRPIRASLEEAYLRLTARSGEYAAVTR